MPFSPPKTISVLSWPLSRLYGIGVNIRNRRFDLGRNQIKKLPKPVISVGNITVGGTGKTPVVAYLTEILNQHNLSVVVLTRGYKRDNTDSIVLTKDNLDQIPFRKTGDEARLLAKRISNGGIVIDEDRWRGGNIATKQLNPDVFILDDGFQHRRLFRNIDIVTLDAKHPFGNGFLLPGGPLREPIENLSRADFFWITRSDKTNIEVLNEMLDQFSDKPHVFSIHKPMQVIELSSHQNLPIEFLRGKEVIAFAGIANPNSFLETLTGLGAKVKQFLPFQDHHNFTKRDIDSLKRIHTDSNANIWVTTEKDAVRFSKEITQDLQNFYFLQIAVRVTRNDSELKKILKLTNIL